jgi:hypothetical protein
MDIAARRRRELPLHPVGRKARFDFFFIFSSLKVNSGLKDAVILYKTNRGEKT